MSRTIDATSDFQSFQDDDPTPAQQVQEQLRGKFVCPFCGTIGDNAEAACSRCTMENSPLTRQATKARLGPWYVLQTRNPSAPGMKYSVLLSLVKKGQITPRSIIRGPTTNQFWRFAAKVKGLSREFGICWGCGTDIEPTVDVCPHCQRSQLPPENPDQLLDGRQPISQILPVRREIRPAFRDEQVAESVPPVAPATAPRREPPPPAAHEMPLRHTTSRDTAAREAAAREARQRRPVAPAVEPTFDALVTQKPPIPARPNPQPMLTQGPVLVRPRPMDPEPQQPLGRVLLLLVLMAIFTVAGWLYVDHTTRSTVFTWVKTQWTNLTADQQPAPSTGVQIEPVPDLKGQKIVTAPSEPTPPVVTETPAPAAPKPPTTPKAAETSPAPTNTVPEGMKLAEVVPLPPTQAPAAQTPPVQTPAARPQAQAATPAPQATPTPPPVVEIKVDRAPGAVADARPQPQPEAPKAAEEGEVEVNGTADVHEAIRKSRILNRQAIDAEAAGDYVTAVKLYEQIERLPPAAWPMDLQLRLTYARNRVKQ